MVESDRLAGRGYRVASVRSRSARPARAFRVPGHVTAHRTRHGARSRGRRPMTRQEFIRVLTAATVAGFVLDRRAAGADALYDPPKFGNVSLLHFTDCHAQLRPVHFREPSVNLGVGVAANRPPHLVGERLLRYFGIASGTREAHALTHLDFARAAAVYGRVGGFAHLATLVKRLRAGRPGALLLDAGDTWQGSATALWTRGQDMVDAARALGVDVMTGHWEFTHGAARVREIVEGDLKGRLDFVAHNVKTLDFGDPVFAPYALREVNGVAVAVMGGSITRVRAPWEARLAEPLAVTEGLLYRRGNFNGPWDEVLLDALMTVKGAQIALSPGFRWGGTLLPGQTITMEDVMGQTALTYPQTTLTDMTGEALKTLLEDVCDNLFNPDPYYQQGGDMVRVGGLTYACDPSARAGRRISDLRLGGTLLDAGRTYRVAGWAPVSQEARAAGGEPIWDVVARYLRDRKTVPPLRPNVPVLHGVGGNAGLAS